MCRPKEDPQRLICGMTPETAKRYIVVRQEMKLITDRVHTAGYYLSQFEKAAPVGIRSQLCVIGRIIMHDAMLLHDYLESEFVSLSKVYSVINELKE
jgi:hypothetical protein